MPRIPATPLPEPTAATAADGTSWALCLALILAGLFVYAPALHGTWLWDDQTLFVLNGDMRSLAGLERIWFGHTQTDYWPLTSTALWIEMHLWGSHPLPYHVVSLALHLWSAFLIWRLFSRLGLNDTSAWVGALLFVIHPLAVESVAWISELKNTLSLPLFLLALLAWLDFDAQKSPTDYRRALLWFTLAMLAKTSGIMLPAVLLLYSWWKHDRVTPLDLKRITPFLLVALVLGVITKASQGHEAQTDDVLRNMTLLSHLACAGRAIVFYLTQFLLPYRLLPIYPRWSVEPPTMLQLAALPMFALVLAGLWTRRNSWGRHALLGFGFFLLNVLPVSGLVIMSYMNITWVADHLAYIPMIGLIGLVAAALQAASHALPRVRAWQQVGVAVLCLGLAWSSYLYAHAFDNEITLWKYAARFNADSWDVQSNFANAYLNVNEPGEALEHAALALKLRPELARSYAEIGNVLAQTPGRLPDAAAAYEEALARDSYFPRAHVSLGAVDERLGHVPEAITQYREAIAQDAGDARAHLALASALATMPEHLPEAAGEFQEAEALAPDRPDIHNDYGGVLIRLPGRLSDAVLEFDAALRLQPGFVAAHYNRGLALAQMAGRTPDAVTEFEEVLRLEPAHLGARYNLAVALAQTKGRTAEAVPLLQAVVQARPDFAPAQALLSKLQAGL